MISSVHFGRGLSCDSNFIFFYIDDKEETNLIARSRDLNLKLFLKIYKYSTFKQNKSRAYCNFIKYFFCL